MPRHRVSGIAAHLRVRLVCVASTTLCIPSALSSAQLSVSDHSPGSVVAGEGLSPSYFLPPSPTIPAAPLSAPPPTTDNRSLVGSGVPSPPIIPDLYGPSVGTPPNKLPDPSGLPRVAPSPLEPTAQQPPVESYSAPKSVELDLRSSNAQVGSSPFAPPAYRPLTPPSPWFFSSNALILNFKEQENRVFSSSLNDPSTSLLETNDVRMASTGGFELGIGRYFGSGKYALNANYWGISPSDSVSMVNSSQAGTLVTRLPLNVPSTTLPGTTEGLFVGGTPISNLFQNAPEHRLESQRDFNNVELNLYWFALGGAARQPLAPSCTESQCWSLSAQPTSPNANWLPSSSRLRLSLFSGVRWFQFQDALRYSASETYYKSSTQNDLWGIQSGAMTHFLITSRWSIWNNFNAGVYNNRSLFQTSAGTAGTLATIVSSSTSETPPFDFDSSDNTPSFLGETTTGLAWHFARGWTSNLGYRILGVSGISTAQGQIPNDFRIPSQIAHSANNESLILHGVVLGATYNF